ncbi:MAG: Verru_Chthon cassette protein A, partial [Roseimicrobium sp.]
PRGSDVLFTMVPKHGDHRLLAAKRVVPITDWILHPRAASLGNELPGQNGGSKIMMANNLARYGTSAEPGFYADTAPYANRLVPQANYVGGSVPDVVVNPATTMAMQKYGDFDNAVGSLRDGAWINKPDEGNTGTLYRVYQNSFVRAANAYLSGWDEWVTSEAGESFMTPNRMMPSAVMFGSLPSVIWGSEGGSGGWTGESWRTLLFHPYTSRQALGGQVSHPGSPSSRGGVDPADHYLLDLFWMPIVEPYAISEPFSTAGKVNLNYQMLPFGKYIRRATGIHAVMKGEMLAAIPRRDAHRYKRNPRLATDFNAQYKMDTADGYSYFQPFSDVDATKYTSAWSGNATQGSDNGRKYWYRQIEVEKRIGTSVNGTIKQFEDRFNFVNNGWTPASSWGLFRTASQICEVHLMPKKVSGTAVASDGSDQIPGNPYTPDQMANFWGANSTEGRSLTGDNLKERPYASFYGKITTKSNTFRVHYRAQAIRKARSSSPEQFDSARDTVLTDYRGSSLIERRIDPADARIPDYGASSTPATLAPLDNFYRMRVLEVKRLIP